MTELSHDVLKDRRRVGRVLSRVGDKWSVLVIFLLQAGPRRFNELKRRIDGISQQMLTRTLRALEREGLVSRTVLPSSPPQVAYALTAIGQSLSGPVLALGRWACEHIEAIDDAQRRFDEMRDKGMHGPLAAGAHDHGSGRGNEVPPRDSSGSLS
ncbi:winged helix-turn-helix transcriptional regulator [Burkholderia gladioli]|uniref:Helix-turn-helix transcriptional regulator n=1 Tax=Burkholderia gladioli TaxID=28095 RepID=A0AB38TNC1_BURGA|nr:helix-turn-helix domain-containing protein [Burkholderia gladioli]MBJ9673092.1 helix-turn-helix transcriptional regulator [Burkholderia gladioli]MBU9266632.1 helix-turn-helix transcriptional regulator [Burkholderia gladioli]MBU9274618.1 helix-turn-helix transcriptional regulator [Burkholderia gladioli]MBU9319396.1 helix-turn-helix transcriptional regulator [Burkholderia gladioli]MCA8170796.1 helix-turn-helix transcriptional regulator [Burkholderia gladioli]